MSGSQLPHRSPFAHLPVFALLACPVDTVAHFHGSTQFPEGHLLQDVLHSARKPRPLPHEPVATFSSAVPFSAPQLLATSALVSRLLLALLGLAVYFMHMPHAV